MTADEIAFAGGVYDTRTSKAYYYLNSVGGSVTGGNSWWTMSPSRLINSYANVFYVSDGRYGAFDVTTPASLRPVISLKTTVVVSSGNGTAESPYTIKAG